jgi:hypothetical protein
MKCLQSKKKVKAKKTFKDNLTFSGKDNLNSLSLLMRPNIKMSNIKILRMRIMKMNIIILLIRIMLTLIWEKAKMKKNNKLNCLMNN